MTKMDIKHAYSVLRAFHSGYMDYKQFVALWDGYFAKHLTYKQRHNVYRMLWDSHAWSYMNPQRDDDIPF